jgi:hypothetical protein
LKDFKLWQKNAAIPSFGGTAFHQSGISLKQHFIKVAFHQSGISLKQHSIEAAFH